MLQPYGESSLHIQVGYIAPVPAVEQKVSVLLVPAGVLNPVGIHNVPTRPPNGQNATEVRKIVPQLDEGHEVELAQDFRDVVYGGFSAANLAEFADIPDRDVDSFGELGWGDLGCGYSLFESE